MSIIKRGDDIFPIAPLNIWDELRALDKEIPFRTLSLGSWFGDVRTPALNLHEDDENYYVKADLPGMSKEDIAVSIDNGILNIQGERTEETEDESKSCLRKEVVYESFNKTIPFPEDVDEKKVEAKYENGVLSLTVPKKAEAKTEVKKIEIK